uniref:Uncharacterized protein n=1 Tax=Anopheles culicifacies TaxID=139723 RepID=A0A182MVU2_9DIPT
MAEVSDALATYKDLASLAAYGNGVGSSDSRDATTSTPTNGVGGGGIGSNDDESSVSSNLSTGNGNGYRHPGDPDIATTTTTDNGSMEENLDLRDLDLSQLRLSKRDLETLSSITPALSQRVQEQLLAQLPPQQARKLSRTLSMQNGGGATGAQTGTAANQRLYRRSYSNSSGNRSLDSTAEYGANGWSVTGGSELRRRGGSQPRDILSPPPAYQTPAPLYEKYAPYGTSIPTVSSSGGGDSSGMSSFMREYDNTRKPLSPHITLSTGTRASGVSGSSITTGTNTAATPLRYTSSTMAGDPSALPTATKRLSRFLRPDFFDTPKEMVEKDGSSERSSPYSSQGGGVTMREGATGRQQRREKLANDTITDRLSYFLEKYGKPDDEPAPIGDRARRSVSRTREHLDEVEKQPEQQYRTPAETLSLLQEQLQDLTNMTSLAAGNQMSKLLRGDEDPAVQPAKAECQLAGCTECEGKQEESTVPTVTPSTSEIKESAAGATEASAATPSVKKVVKVKKVKVVKKVTSGTESSAADKAAVTGDVVDTAPPTATVVKKVKKLDTGTSSDVKESSTGTIAPTIVKKESKLMRPKSYPYKETVQDGAKLSVAGDIELETNGKTSTTATKEPSAEVQTNGSASPAVSGTSAASTVSKLARPKSFPSSKLTPPKELKLLKPSASETEAQDATQDQKVTTKAESASGTPTTPVSESVANGTAASSATSPPKKVKKVIRIVKKVTKTTDSNGKVVVTTTTMPVDGGPVKVSKETSTKTVTIKEQPSVADSTAEKLSTAKEKSKSPEKKPKQGFLASIGQRFEKFRDTSRSSKEKKAAAVAAAAAATTTATTASEVSNETLPDTAVPAMVPRAAQIVEGVTPDVLMGKPSEPATLKKDKKKSGKTTTKVSQSVEEKSSAEDPIAKTTSTTTGGRKSRIDTVIRNLRELSTGPKLPELTESKLIKRAVSVEEMPGTFNRCGVTKVLGLFKKIEKDSRNNVHHRLLNTKSSSHIMVSGRTADEAMQAPMPDLMQPVPVEFGRVRNGDSLLPAPTQSRKKLYGGARSDTVLPLQHPIDSLLSNGVVDSGDYDQRKFKMVSAACQSQIPVKYGCPGCDTGNSSANGSTTAGNNNGVHGGGMNTQTATETGSSSNGVQRPPPQDTDRRGRARALTIDLEQAVHSATEKLKRLQQANSIHLSNIPTQQLLHHHSNNNNYMSNPSKTSSTACTKIPSSHNTANGTTNTSSSTPAAPVGGNNNYSYPPPLPGEMAAPGTATSPGGYNSMNNNNINNINNNPPHHYSTLTPSYDSITNYSSGSRSSPYDDNSSSTFLSPSEERELYFDSWSVCSDELNGAGGGGPGGRPLNSSSVSPAPSSSASRRHSSVRLLTSNPPLHSVSPVDPDAESVIERIRRKSYYTRFNDTKKPAKRASASNLGALGGSGSTTGMGTSSHVKDTGTGGNSYGYYGNATASSGTVREKSLSRGGSSSYILRPNKESSFSGVGKYDTTTGYATFGRTEHHHRGYATMVNLTKTNRSAARLRNSSLDVVPLATSADYQHHQPHHYHHHHHHRQQQSTLGASLSRTGSRLLSTDDDPLTDGLNYTNLINNNNNSTNTSNHKYTRNTYYESTAVPSSYGTYTPRRRSSFVASGGYGSSNIASSSSSIALDLLKDHRDGSASHSNLATTASSSSSNTLSASDNYGIGSSNSTASRTIRPYENRSSSLLTPTALREAGRYSGRYDSGTLTKNYRTRTSSTSKSTDNA